MEVKLKMVEFKVSSKSEAKKVAGALSYNLQNGECVKLIGIGVGAVNTMVKAIIISSSHLTAGGVQVNAVPSFIDLDVDGVQKTGISYLVSKAN